jgi:hypothetical protein
LNDVVTKTKQVSIEDAENLINPVAATFGSRVPGPSPIYLQGPTLLRD